MHAVQIERDPTQQFLARCGPHHAVGATAGQALDALNAILAAQPGPISTTLVVVQARYEPDPFFTAAQIDRLKELMAASRRANETGDPMAADQKAELQQLIDAELAGAARRAASLFPRAVA